MGTALSTTLIAAGFLLTQAEAPRAIQREAPTTTAPAARREVLSQLFISGVENALTAPIGNAEIRRSIAESALEGYCASRDERGLGLEPRAATGLIIERLYTTLLKNYPPQLMPIIAQCIFRNEAFVEQSPEGDLGAQLYRLSRMISNEYREAAAGFRTKRGAYPSQSAYLEALNGAIVATLTRKFLFQSEA